MGNHFSLRGRKKFYEERELIMPKRCKSCRTSRKAMFEKKKKAYKFDEEFTVDEIVKFVNQFLNGQLIPVDFGDL